MTQKKTLKSKKITLDDAYKIIPDKQEVFSKAQEVFPDVKIYDLQNDVLSKDLEITKTGYKPTLTANAGLNSGYTNTQDYTYFNQLKNNFNKSLGLSLNIPIFSKKQNDTNVKLAKIEIEQNKLDKISAQKTLYSNIETAWQNAILTKRNKNLLKLPEIMQN